MTDLERYVIQEYAGDFKDGIMSRRELLRRVTLITGSAAATMTALALVGCDLTQRQPAAPAPSESVALTAAYATPPPKATTDGITVKADDPRIKAERVEVKGPDGATLIGYVARPAGQGRAPGILVAHENRGLVEHIKDVIRRLGTAGFSALGIELLSRQGGAERLTDPGAYAAELTKRPVADMVADQRAALDYLRNQSFVRSDRLGMTGFCFGGGQVWRVLAAGADLKAAVPFYGPPPEQLDRLASAKAAVFAIYGELDSFVTPSSQKVEEQLKKTGQPYQIKVYPNAMHAFNNDTNASRYNPEQAQLAWVATIDWFRKYLA